MVYIMVKSQSEMVEIWEELSEIWEELSMENPGQRTSSLL